MFLITTADERFWKKDAPVLFLGEWCKLYSRRHVWNALEHKVLPYHWEDRKRLFRDIQYLNNLYEDVLVQLSAVLNRLHDENHSVRYWRIVIGPWLYGFISILYDRYASICSAEASGTVSDTMIAEYPQGYWTPLDYSGFSGRFSDDAYNHYLYGKIIELSGRIPYNRQYHPALLSAPGEDHPPSSSTVSLAKYLANTYAAMIPDSFKRAVFISTFFSVKDHALLQGSLGQCPFLIFPRTETPARHFDGDLRANVRVRRIDAFTDLLSRLIAEQMPQLYLESYRSMKSNALGSLPSMPRIIFTANDHVHNDCFKLWAADHAERGVLFIGTQHGGFEGMGQWYSLEEHQKKIWDRYFSWGWESAADRNITPLPAGKLNSLKKIRPKEQGRILMANTAFMRYAYFMQSMPIGASGQEAYLRDLFNFILGLDNAARELLTVRAYLHDFQYCQEERFREKFPNVDYYAGGKPFHEHLSECRLFIGNNNGTTILEALAANVPSVIFWDPAHWEIRDSATPYFEKLRGAGIFHDTPASAAALVNQIYRDPLAWWRQPAVQDAKEVFCHQFARTSDTCIKEWANELRSLLSSREGSARLA